MRKISLLAISALATLGAPALVQAAPPPCGGSVTVDCLKDDVLVINGDVSVDLGADMGGPGPLVTCATDMTTMKPNPADCKLDYARAAKQAINLAGPGDSKRWDEFVIFGQQISPAKDAPGPLF